MSKTKEQIHRYAKAEKPFFLAYGAHRPHLPWNIPRKYWDMYKSTESIDLPTHQGAPEGMPPIAFTYECDGQRTVVALNESAPIPYPDPSTALPENMTRTLRRGYYASVTWTDYLIGQLLDALEAEDVLSSTVVALIGDHGEWTAGSWARTCSQRFDSLHALGTQPQAGN